MQCTSPGCWLTAINPLARPPPCHTAVASAGCLGAGCRSSARQASLGAEAATMPAPALPAAAEQQEEQALHLRWSSSSTSSAARPAAARSVAMQLTCTCRRCACCKPRPQQHLPPTCPACTHTARRWLLHRRGCILSWRLLPALPSCRRQTHNHCALAHDPHLTGCSCGAMAGTGAREQGAASSTPVTSHQAPPDLRGCTMGCSDAMLPLGGKAGCGGGGVKGRERAVGRTCAALCTRAMRGHALPAISMCKCRLCFYICILCRSAAAAAAACYTAASALLAALVMGLWGRAASS